MTIDPDGHNSAQQRIAQLQARRSGAAAPPTGGRRKRPHVAAGGRVAASGLAASAVLGLTGTIASANKATFAEPAPVQQSAASRPESNASPPSIGQSVVPSPTLVVMLAIPPASTANGGTEPSVPGSVVAAAAPALPDTTATTAPARANRAPNTSPATAPVSFDPAPIDNELTPAAAPTAIAPETTAAAPTPTPTTTPTATTEPPSVPPPPPPSPPTTTKPSK